MKRDREDDEEGSGRRRIMRYKGPLRFSTMVFLCDSRHLPHQKAKAYPERHSPDTTIVTPSDLLQINSSQKQALSIALPSPHQSTMKSLSIIPTGLAISSIFLTLVSSTPVPDAELIKRTCAPVTVLFIGAADASFTADVPLGVGVVPICKFHPPRW